MPDHKVTAQVAHTTHHQNAQELLDSGVATLVPRALVEATLAQVEAIDRLTAVLEDMEFPALEIKKAGSGLSTRFSITPFPLRRVGRAS